MSVMILGAGGYLGGKLAAYLSDSFQVTGVYRKIPEGMGGSAILADMESIRVELQRKRYEWVVNCAAVYEGGAARSDEIIEANMIFALRALNCAAKHGAGGFLTIDTALPRDINLYSFTKKEFSEFGKFYAKKHEIPFINVLLEMFYGEDEPPGRFLSDLCRGMIHGKELFLTEGKQKRDIIYIDDVCRAIKLLLGAGMKGFHNVPLGSGEAVPVRCLVEHMHEVLGSRSRLNFGAVPARPCEPDCVADIRLISGLGFVPRYPWRQGIRLLCEKIKGIEEKMP